MMFLLTLVVATFAATSPYAAYCDVSEGERWCDGGTSGMPGCCCEGPCLPTGGCGECEMEWEDMPPQIAQPGTIPGDNSGLPVAPVWMGGMEPGEGGDGAEEGNWAAYAGHPHDNGCYSPLKWCEVTKSCYNPFQGQRCPCPPKPLCGCQQGMNTVYTKDANQCIVSCSCEGTPTTPVTPTTPGTGTVVDSEGEAKTPETEAEKPETAEAGETPETAEAGETPDAPEVKTPEVPEVETNEVETNEANEAPEVETNEAAEASEVEKSEGAEAPEVETAEVGESEAEIGGLLRQSQPVEPEATGGAPSALPQLALVSGVGFTVGVLLAFFWRKQTAKPKISFEDFYQDISLDVQ